MIEIVAETEARANQIEKQTGIPVPDFIRHPKKVENLAKKEINLLTELERVVTNPDRFPITVQKEQLRRQRRDQDILRLERALLARRQIIVPETITNLLDYCGWLPEFDGTNPQIREWASQHSYWLDHLHTPQQVYWDLLSHYQQIIKQAARQVDPLGDWEAYCQGRVNLADYQSWDLQNMGDEDISYFSMTQKWGGGARTLPTHHEYQDIFLVHTTPLENAREILAVNEINSDRVCFSAGRIIQMNAHQHTNIAFLFPRQILEKTYSIEAYLESGYLDHEREVRAHEPVSMDFCVGFLPIDPYMNHQLIKSYQGRVAYTWAVGGEELTAWGQRYQRENRVWSEEELEKVRQSLENEGNR